MGGRLGAGCWLKAVESGVHQSWGCNFGFRSHIYLGHRILQPVTTAAGSLQPSGNRSVLTGSTAR
jgi:hypothetical protein